MFHHFGCADCFCFFFSRQQLRSEMQSTGCLLYHLSAGCTFYCTLALVIFCCARTHTLFLPFLPSSFFLSVICLSAEPLLSFRFPFFIRFCCPSLSSILLLRPLFPLLLLPLKKKRPNCLQQQDQQAGSSWLLSLLVTIAVQCSPSLGARP